MSNTISILAARYAKALLDLAEQNNSTNDVEKDVVSLLSLVNSSSEFDNLLYNPSVSASRKVAAMRDVMKSCKAHDLTSRFALLMASNRRLDVLVVAMQKFLESLKEKRGEVTANVTVIRELSKEQVSRLEATLSESLNKKVSTSVQTDPSILGGVVVTIGSLKVDGSVSGKLNRLKHISKQAVANL